MSDLEKSYLYPVDNSKMSKELAESVEADRCQTCGGLHYWGGRLGAACSCPRPEPEPEKQEFKPYIPVGDMKVSGFQETTIGQEYHLTEATRLNTGLRMMNGGSL